MSTLLGEWGFLNNLDDTSGNNHHGVYHEVEGVEGFEYVDGPQQGSRAIRFGDVDQGVALGSTGLEPSSSDGGVTTMGWFRCNSGSLTSAPEYLGIVSRPRAVDSTRAGFQLKRVSGQNSYEPFVVFRWKSRLRYGSFGYGAITPNEWHHFAAVDGEYRCALFIDGVKTFEFVEDVSGSASEPTWENGYQWHVGFAPDLDASYDGLDITQARIFAGALSDVEVATWKDTPVISSPPDTSNNLRLGTKTPSSYFLGAKPVASMYLGTTKVFGVS